MRALKRVPRYLDEDGNERGAFEERDIFKTSDSTAAVLVKEGYAEEL
jgi:hypothetical protein